MKSHSMTGNQESKQMANGRMKRETFAELVEHERAACAKRAFARAAVASDLRHAARRGGHYQAARALGEIKAQAIGRAIQILPDAVKVRSHVVHGHTLLLVKLGRRGLHLPARLQQAVAVLPAPSSLKPLRRVA